MSSLWHPFTRYPLNGEPHFPKVVQAKGAYLLLADGRLLFDAISSWWTIVHGHAHPILRRAVNRQLQMLDHVIFAGFVHPAAEELANQLTKLTGYDKVFFSDNGSTAVEVALKIALQYEYNSKGERTTIYALEKAYHGDTFGAMSAAGVNVFSQPFKKFLFFIKQIPLPKKENYPAIKAILKKIATEKPLAFIYEPLVQGAGGMIFQDPEVLEEILFTFHKAKALLIADEVFTGFYRTGSLLASDTLSLRPHLVALAKGITGGFLPLGATLTYNDIFNSFRDSDGSKTFYHGHSYTAYPAACAAAVANLKLLQTQATQRKKIQLHHGLAKLKEQLANIPQLYQLRQLGGILAFEVGTRKSHYKNSLRDKLYNFFIQNGILLRPLGNTVYLVPPLCTSHRELELTWQVLQKLPQIV